MTPQEKKEFNNLKKTVEELKTVTNVSFIENLVRRLPFLSTNSVLQDLADVENTTGASTGQVLKKTATTWQPGTDNIA